MSEKGADLIEKLRRQIATTDGYDNDMSAVTRAEITLLAEELGDEEREALLAQVPKPIGMIKHGKDGACIHCGHKIGSYTCRSLHD